jgi:hypothetical protein
MSIFPWNRSPYHPPPDDSPQAVLLPSGALIEPEQLRIDRGLGRRQEEQIRARAEEREAAAAEAEAEKEAQRETIKRELLDELRGAGGIAPSG